DDGRTGAWHAAAGMLAPVAEAAFGEHRLTELLVASVAAWPAFAADLGGPLEFAVSGSLLVGVTEGDEAEIARYLSYQESLGLPVTSLTAARLRLREPALHPGVRAGAYTEIDAQVDPRALVARLRQACREAGARTVSARVTDVRVLDADVTVVAAGCGSADLVGVPVHPVRGETLRLRGGPRLAHMVRGHVHGRHVYLVPRPNGEIVVGATSSEETAREPTVGGVQELLNDAIALVPELRQAEFREAAVGFRPGTADNLPIVERREPGLIVATGHYRNGIALTPWTAARVVELAEVGA
ncbi:MAG: FAD-dependent oxidoreductase, partial [Hamadaea sp.]|nr:FAD-dependent oxidoreductase [Hamadaea sp.]